MSTDNWISVEDSFPAERELVLCYQKSNYKYAIFLVLARIDDKFYDITDSAEIATTYFPNITHWQELPPPPNK